MSEHFGEIAEILGREHRADAEFTLFTVSGFEHREDERRVLGVVHLVVLLRFHFLIQLFHAGGVQGMPARM
ncbi:hypothetical protein D3C80_1731690 [compost metagenome]